MRAVSVLLAVLWGVAAAGCDDGSSGAPPDGGAADRGGDVGEGDVGAGDVGANDLGADEGAAPDMAADQGPPALAPLGYRRDEVRYTPTGDAVERVIPMFWWYPAADRAAVRATYRLFVAEGVFVDAPPAVPAGAPLMVFSHGRSGFAQYSYFIAEHFARQGWVVVGADHIGDTVSDAANTAEIYRWRPEDVSAVIDFAQNPPAGHPLAGAVGETVVVAGHSFGGYTTLAVAGAEFAVDTWLAACAEADPPQFCGEDFTALAPIYRAGFGDARVDLVVPMAPGNFPLFEAGLGAVEVPVLMMTANRDTSTGDVDSGDPIWGALPVDARHRRVRFTNGGHFTFTVLCPVIGALGRDNGCGPDFTPAVEMHPVILAYMDAFIGRHLFADESGAGLLDGEVSLHEEVTVEAKAGR